VVLSKPRLKLGEGNHIPRCDGEIRGYFPSANMMDKNSAKKEGVAGEESDGGLSRSVLDECAEVLDPTANSGIIGMSCKVVSDPAKQHEVEDADQPISRVAHQLKEIPTTYQGLAVPAISPISLMGHPVRNAKFI